jgi:hypothetical protein
MSVMNDLTDLWQANGEQPHETAGPAPQMNVPHGTQEDREHFDPLSAGASKAIHQVRKNVGQPKSSFMRPFVELLGNIGTAGLRSSDSLMAQELGKQEFNPYAAHDAEVAQNMQIMQFLAQQEQARQIHELRQQQLAQQEQHNRALEQYYSSPTGTNTGSKRYAPTNLGKLYQEKEKAVEMFGEGSPQVQTYDLAIQKATTDSDTRRRSLFASNLEKSMDAIDADDITRYSGPQGALQLKAEQAKDLSGHPSKEYLRYKNALQANQFETSELRQFFGDSVTEHVREHLQKISNPSSLGLSPKAAKSQLETSRKIIKKQLDTYRGALSGTEQHRGLSSQVKPVSEMSTQDIRQELNRLKGTE